MVERVLEILPQDQLYALFFDEFESNKQFAAFVDSISSPKFAKILSGLQVSWEIPGPPCGNCISARGHALFARWPHSYGYAYVWGKLFKGIPFDCQLHNNFQEGREKNSRLLY